MVAVVDGRRHAGGGHHAPVKVRLEAHVEDRTPDEQEVDHHKRRRCVCQYVVLDLEGKVDGVTVDGVDDGGRRRGEHEGEGRLSELVLGHAPSAALELRALG